MMNWAKSQKVGLSMLQFLGDPNSEFTKALVSSWILFATDYIINY